MIKRSSLLLVFISVTGIVFGKQLERDDEWFLPQPFRIVSSEPNAALDQNHAQFELTFENYLLNIREALPEIELSCNGVIQRFQLDSTLMHTLTVSPGKYQFKIKRNGNYGEVLSDSITILPAHLTKAEVQFPAMFMVVPDPPVTVCKPVIYFHSPKNLSVNIELTPKGKFTFTYPVYENGWKGTVEAEGGITVNKQHYPYLFWEANSNEINSLVNYNEGFVVSKENVTAFLEEKLTEMGLNDQERTDFITFWGPRMVGSEKNHVQFLFNEEYDDIAALSITPKPDHTFRLYMLWTPMPESTIVKPTPQKLSTVKRDGFSVVEWGGSELKYNETVADHE
ncbi:MAG: hypothetical protein QE487_08565 [Fluviicola sp.]|nr:hypothetical protein [Fluviicola sp.]